MTYKEVNVIGKDAPEREKYKGKHPISIVSMNRAFGLLTFAFHDLKEVVHNIAEGDDIWAFINDLAENQKITKENNTFEAIIVLTDDRFYDDGPNHCGIRCDGLKWYKPTKFGWVRPFFKNLLFKLNSK